MMFRPILGYRQSRPEDFTPLPLRSADGSQLEAVLASAREPAHGVVIFCHPFLKYGYHYFVKSGLVDAVRKEGFHCLLFNFKGVGASELKGGPFHEDVSAAIGLARRRFPDLPLYLLGASFGGYQAVHALARDDGQVRAALLDSVPLSATHFFQKGLTGILMRWLSRSRWAHRTGTEPLLSSLTAIQRTRLHLLYGAQDAYCPVEERDRLGTSLPGLRVTALPEVGHLQGYKRAPDQFMRAVREQFSTSIVPSEGFPVDFPELGPMGHQP
jgi:hypothetical protein